jgi:hypothetical protein
MCCFCNLLACSAIVSETRTAGSAALRVCRHRGGWVGAPLLGLPARADLTRKTRAFHQSSTRLCQIYTDSGRARKKSPENGRPLAPRVAQAGGGGGVLGSGGVGTPMGPPPPIPLWPQGLWSIDVLYALLAVSATMHVSAHRVRVCEGGNLGRAAG